MTDEQCKAIMAAIIYSSPTANKEIGWDGACFKAQHIFDKIKSNVEKK